MGTSKYKPIGMDWGTLPTLYANNNGGEVYEWGEYLMTFQEKPVTQNELYAIMEGKHFHQDMKYHYSMQVFNNTGEFKGVLTRPILVLSLEYVDYSSAESSIPEIGEIIEFGKEAIYIGMFDADRHRNFGLYEGSLDPEEVKKLFFSILGKELNLDSRPQPVNLDPFIYI